MKIFSVVSKPMYALVAVLSSIVMAIIYIYTQVLGNLHNVGLWFSIIPWYNAVLFIIFAVLFGVTFSYQIYLWRQPKSCSVGQKAKGAGTSSVATIAAFLVAQCPACASLGALFLPLSAATFLTQASVFINVLSIALLIFTLNYLGGFKSGE